jgi:hypothetical protein
MGVLFAISRKNKGEKGVAKEPHATRHTSSQDDARAVHQAMRPRRRRADVIDVKAILFHRKQRFIDGAYVES